MSVATPNRKRPATTTPAAKLRAVIAASGKTQEAFARDFGVSIRTLRGWLYGDRQPGQLARNFIDRLFADLPK
jgi:DNA-binding transcriptional regulator YiaG